MKQNYSRILITKLSPCVHDELKNLAMNRRRTLSSLSRIIIEDFLQCQRKGAEKNMESKNL